MERRGIEIRVRLRVDTAAKVIVRIGLRTDLRGKQRQGGIPSVNLHIADGRLLDPDLGGVGDGVLHTFLQGHRSLSAGAHCHSGRQTQNHTFNDKIVHIVYCLTDSSPAPTVPKTTTY